MLTRHPTMATSEPLFHEADLVSAHTDADERSTQHTRGCEAWLGD